MNWLMWRLYRKQTSFIGLAVIAYAIVLVIVGNHTWSAFNQALTTGGIASFQLSPLANTLQIASLVLPLLLGMFWGAPLVAKECAEGTHKFVWTQSVTRRKWLLTKFAWLTVWGVLFAAILSVAVTRLARTESALRFDRFEVLPFSMQGLTPVAYTIFAIALGTCVGAWLRSSIRSVVVTMLVWPVVVFGVAMFIRPHYLRPLSVPGGGNLHAAIDMRANKISPGAGAIWILHTQDKILSENCTVMNGSPVCSGEAQTVRTVYQPANRYWTFQGIESGLYIVLSCLLGLGAYRLVQKRDI